MNPNGGGGSRGAAGSNARHSTIFNEKNRFIKNCLNGSRLLGSDGDINHNGNNFITLPSGAATMANGRLTPVDLVAAGAGGATSPCGLTTVTTGTTAAMPIKTA